MSGKDGEVDGAAWQEAEAGRLGPDLHKLRGRDRGQHQRTVLGQGHLVAEDDLLPAAAAAAAHQAGGLVAAATVERLRILRESLMHFA